MCYAFLTDIVSRAKADAGQQTYFVELAGKQVGSVKTDFAHAVELAS